MFVVVETVDGNFDRVGFVFRIDCVILFVCDVVIEPSASSRLTVSAFEAIDSVLTLR